MMASQTTTLEKKFAELQKSEQTPQSSRPKIQRVAYYRRRIPNFGKYYTPKLVSIGPIHHDRADLKLGEKYKLMWAAKYIENAELNPRYLHKKIADSIDKLKDRFSEDVLTLTRKSLEGFGSLDEKLSWILFVDGCSLLHILEKGAMNIKLDQPDLLITDVLLLENQLPYEVLKLLWKDIDNKESELIKSMTNFLECHYWATPDESQPDKENGIVPTGKGEEEHSLSIPLPNESQSEKEKEGEGEHSLSIPLPNESQSEKEKEGEGEHSVSISDESQSIKENDIVRKEIGEGVSILDESQTPAHLLDLQRKIILTTSNSKSNIVERSPKKNQVKPITYRGIEDLRAVGIRLKASATRRPTDVDFTAGWFTAKLTIPVIYVNNLAASTLLNLIAYEMCPDFDNDYGICSYVAFMDSLIDHPEDVKALRSKGILCTVWSDEEVASLFNIIGTDLVTNIVNYFEVQVQLRDHYFNKYKTWIALGFRTYFKNPLTVIAFLVAFTALLLLLSFSHGLRFTRLANKGGSL